MRSQLDFTLRLPSEPSPADGWPVLLLMHGYASNRESLGAVTLFAAELGFAAITVSGPIVLDTDCFQWPSDSVDGTHDHLQTVLDDVEKKHKLNRSNVSLIGFSQGGLHAILLLATRPSFYRAAIAFSPGGWLQVPDKPPYPDQPRLLVLCYANDDLPGTVDKAIECQVMWEIGGFPLKVVTHDEGHELPSHWPELLREVVDENP